MKASEVTEPGLYFVIDELPGMNTVVLVDRDCDSDDAGLVISWIGHDSDDRLPPPSPKDWDGMDFIGPFPPPGEGPKFAGFKAALEALCRAYGVSLATSSYDALGVWDADAGLDEPLHCNGFEDNTRPVKG